MSKTEPQWNEKGDELYPESLNLKLRLLGYNN